jgi:hypothetical protein
VSGSVVPEGLHAAVYRAALNPGGWSEALARVAALVGGVSSTLICGGGPGRLNLAAAELDTVINRSYDAEFGLWNSWGVHMAPRLVPLRAAATPDYVPVDAVMRPQEIPHGVSVVLANGGRRVRSAASGADGLLQEIFGLAEAAAPVASIPAAGDGAA